jgi:hypothetical protein
MIARRLTSAGVVDGAAKKSGATMDCQNRGDEPHRSPLLGS